MSGWPEMVPASDLRLGSGVLALAIFALLACQPARTDQPAATEGAVQSPAQPDGFTLSSSEFGEGQPIPRRYACDGDNVSPPLAWSGAPGESVALAMVMD